MYKRRLTIHPDHTNLQTGLKRNVRTWTYSIGSVRTHIFVPTIHGVVCMDVSCLDAWGRQTIANIANILELVERDACACTFSCNACLGRGKRYKLYIELTCDEADM